MVKSFSKAGPASISKLAMSALFTALIAVLAQLAIPLPFSPVPFTGQVLGVFMAGSLLGRRAGLLSVTAYLLLGAAGAPVFSLGRGGLHVLIGPGGGYLWGFIPAVYITGLLIEKQRRASLYLDTAVMLAALLLIYLFGALQLALIMQYSAGQAIAVGIIPFLPLDLLKAFIAASLGIKIKKRLQHNQLSHLLK